jgi:hypothetical protein
MEWITTKLLSPITKFSPIRCIFALATLENMEIHQMDVKTTFLDGELKEEIYMEKPQRFCRNPTLAKCGGEAQHLEKVGIGVLRDSRKLRRRFGRPKHLALRCSWCHWKDLET